MIILNLAVRIKRVGLLLAAISVNYLYSKPVADFSAPVTSGCNPLKVDFINRSTGAVSYLWDLGNSNSSMLVNPSAVYNVAGRYTISLIVKDKTGAADTLILKDFITVFKSPVADFVVDKQNVCTNDTIHFSDRTVLGDTGIKQYTWDMGNGNILYGNNPPYSYPANGIYDIAMAVTDMNGCISIHQEIKYIQVNSMPIVNLASSPSGQCKAPAKVTFNAQAYGNGPFIYKWEFGDSQTSTSQNPDHLYTKERNYTVVLNVYDRYGCRNRQVQTDIVHIGPPKANFDFSDPNICEGQKIQFTNQSFPNSSNSSTLWDFGDGDTINPNTNPQKSFKTAKNYQVRLTYIWDKCTSMIEKSVLITLKPKPVIKISANDTSICREEGGRLKLSISGSGYDNIQWSKDTFPLRSGDTMPYYLMPIDTNGTFSLRVLVNSKNGCGSAADTIQIHVQGPFARITPGINKGCMPYKSSARFDGSSDAPIIAYQWNSTELNINSTKPSVSFTNNHFGISRLSLSVTDKNGCMDKAVQIFGAGIKIPPKFTADKKEICSNETLTIHNESRTRALDSVAFFWSWFGRDTLPLPSDEYTVIKFRTKPAPIVHLTFTNNSYGCTTQAEILVKVNGPFLAGQVHAYCDKDSLIARNQSTAYTSTYWRYLQDNTKSIIDPTLNVNLPISSTSNLWLFAFNDSTGCKDSMPLNHKADPQDAAFDYTIDCNSHVLNTVNLYKGLRDTFFYWDVANATTSKTTTYRQRHLKNMYLAPGDYTITLRVKNGLYECTKSKQIKFKLISTVSMKPIVKYQSKTCNPVLLSLIDSNYSIWKNAYWSLDQQLIPDSASNISWLYTGTKKAMWVHLNKTDDIKCQFSDSIWLNIGGPLPDVNLVNQDNQDCQKPVVYFNAVNQNAQNDLTYSYLWDFGHRSSTLSSDSVHMPGSGTINVKLTISDNNGCVTSTSRVFQVNAGKPKAMFKLLADTLVACPPLKVGFLDTSVSGFGSLIYRHWDFGDKTGSTKINPAKMYVIPGAYDVSLIVGNNSNCFDTLSWPRLAVVKGPNGSLNIDQNYGCTPLNVNLGTKTTTGIAKMAFDMGDGVVLDAGQKAHQYTKSGSYIPRLILMDSNGCKYSPEPKDTIHVYNTPKVVLTGANVCKGQSYDIAHQVICEDSIVEMRWNINGKPMGSSDTLRTSFNTLKNNYVHLFVGTGHQCKDSATAIYTAYGLKAALSVPKDEYCLGDKVLIKDASNSDTTVSQHWLNINSQNQKYGTPTIYNANKRGVMSMDFKIMDVLGCSDSILNPVFLKVGDTLAPKVQTIYRTSVVDDSHTETRFEPSKEPDFKDQHLFVFKNNAWQEMASTPNRNDTNITINGLNTLSKSWCHVIKQRNFCGVFTDSTRVIEHCTIETKAFGDTNAGIVKWSPYVGWKKVQTYNIYRKIKSGNSFKYLNSVPGNVLNYVDSAIFCHIQYDYRIEGIEQGGLGNQSFSDTANCKPVNYTPVPAPEVWRTTVTDNSFTRTEWWMPVKPKYEIAYYTLYRNDGSQWNLIKDKSDSSVHFLEDLNTDVQHSNYTYRLTATDVCKTVSPLGNVGRSVLLQVHSEGEQQDAVLNWTAYIYWAEGINHYRIERSVEGSSFAAIGEVEADRLTYTDKDIPKTCVKNIRYRVIAVRNRPASLPLEFQSLESESNHVEYAPEIRFFIPNAFTPNENNLNERFHPDGMYFSGYEMKIYNRWGQKVYEGSECLNAWDGKFMNENAPEGVYAYSIQAWDFQGKQFNFSGSMHLLR